MSGLENYEEIAAYLKDDILIKDINSIKEALDDKKFLLTFVGQFSSGKSKLINNIIEKDLLPVKIKESTQVPTFISYGKEEKAIIFYEDTTKEDISIEKVKEIWLGNQNIEFKNIDHIEILTESKLLETGLIIADTPGVNSIIEKHEKLTRKIINSSEQIVYVLSKPMTLTDQMFLQEIKEIGLKIICVRTFMDAIKSNEEKIEEVIQYDKESIEAIGDSNIIKIYHISNEKDNIWFKKIQTIKEYIEVDISRNVEEKLKESCNLRLLNIRENLKYKLENKKETLELLLEDNKKEIDTDIEKINNAIQDIEKILNNEKKEYDKNCKSVKKEAKKELSKAKICALDDIEKCINKIALNDNFEKELQNVVYTKISLASKKMQKGYIKPFDEFIYDNSILLENRLKDIADNIDVDYEMPSSFNELALTVDIENDEVEELKAEILEIAKYIEDKENQIELLDSSSEEYKKQKKEIENIVYEVKREIESQGVYQEQLIKVENEEIQPSKVLKVLGKGLDIAAFFIPVAGCEKAAAKVGKGLAVAKKLNGQVKNTKSIKGKVSAVKNIKNIVKGTYKTQKRTQNVLDTANKIKRAYKVVPEVKFEEESFLDFLTFEHWFEKAGKNFDKPDVYEVDKEYERQYRETQKILNDKYSKLIRTQVQKLEELGVIKDKKHKAEKEKEIAQKRNKQLKDELSKKQKEIKLKTQKQYFESTKNSYFNLFKDSIDELEEKIILEYDKYLEIPLEKYYEKCISQFKYELNENKKEKEEILNRFETNSIKENKNDLQKCEKYIQLLEG